jgi:hypothetical protein
MVPESRKQPLHFIAFPIRYSPIILSVNAVYATFLRASLILLQMNEID